MATQRALALDSGIVQNELAIQGYQPNALDHRERIDLEQLGVIARRGVIQVRKNFRRRTGGDLQIQPGEHLQGIVAGKTDTNIDRAAAQLVRMSRCNVFDIHAALGGEQHQRTLASRVVQNGSVILAH